MEVSQAKLRQICLHLAQDQPLVQTSYQENAVLVALTECLATQAMQAQQQVANRFVATCIARYILPL